jgi:hypothetical protein
MTSMWKRGSQRLSQHPAIVAECPSLDRHNAVSIQRVTPLNGADSLP